MKRKAILIESSNVAHHNDLPGARIDIDNWTAFLESDLGGAWKTSELEILRKPYSGDVESALSVSSDCYCFVAFSGHGADGSVVLNDQYTNYPIDKLRPKGERGTLIIDACRGVERGRRYAFAKMSSFANESLNAIALNAKSGWTMELCEANAENFSRLKTANVEAAHWITALKNSLKGVVQMLSCSKGQGADEDPNSGGYYTSLLMKSADLWSKSSSNKNIHSTKDAHDYAARELPSQQTPEYSPLWLNFPFAAKP